MRSCGILNGAYLSGVGFVGVSKLADDSGRRDEVGKRDVTRINCQEVGSIAKLRRQDRDCGVFKSLFMNEKDPPLIRAQDLHITIGQTSVKPIY